MKKIRLATLLFAITTLTFNSCKKEPAKTPCTTSSTTIAGTYNMVGTTYKASPTAEEIDYFNDPYIHYAPCKRDNIITYNTNGTYQIIDIGTLCSPLTNSNGTWAFVDTTSMQMDGEHYAINSFDCKTLIITKPNKDIPGDSYKVTLIKR